MHLVTKAEGMGYILVMFIYVVHESNNFNFVLFLLSR